MAEFLTISIKRKKTDHTRHGKHDVDIIRKPNQKIFDNECIRIGEGTIQYVTIESKHGFLKSTSFRFKKKSKKFVVLGQQWKKNINAQVNPGAKKQRMTPQTIHILVYKNVIANGLRTI